MNNGEIEKKSKCNAKRKSEKEKNWMFAKFERRGQNIKKDLEKNFVNICWELKKKTTNVELFSSQRTMSSDRM